MWTKQATGAKVKDSEKLLSKTLLLPYDTDAPGSPEQSSSFMLGIHNLDQVTQFLKCFELKVTLSGKT